MKKILLFILLLSVYSFGQENRTVRMNNLTDSLNTVRASLALKATLTITDSLAEDIAAIEGADTSSLSNRIDAKASLVITDSLAEDINALPTLAETKTEIGSYIDSSYVIAALPTVAETKSFISDSGALKLDKDFDNSYTSLAPSSADEIVYQVEDEDIIYRASLADLPASSEVITSLGGKVSIVGGDQGTDGTYGDRPDYADFYKMFRDSIRAIWIQIGQPVIPTPDMPLNFAMTHTDGAIGAFYLTWTSADTIIVWESTDGGESFSIADTLAPSTNAFSRTGVAGGSTYSYYLVATNGGVLSNETARLTQTIVTGNVYYVSNANVGAGTGTSWATAKEFNSFLATAGSVLEPGDVVYIDGGSGDSLVYDDGTGSYGSYSFSNINGAVNSHITFTRGVDVGHTGTPVFSGKQMNWFFPSANCSYLTISYLKFGHTTTQPGTSLYMRGNYITVEHNEFAVTLGTMMSITGTNGVSILNNTFDTGEISTDGTDCLNVQYSNDLTIAYNYLFNRNSSALNNFHKDVLQITYTNENNNNGYLRIHHNIMVGRGRVTGMEIAQCSGKAWIYNNIMYSGDGSGLSPVAYPMPLNINVDNRAAGRNLELYLYNNTIIGGVGIQLGRSSTAVTLGNSFSVVMKNNLLKSVQSGSPLIALYSSLNSIVADYNYYEPYGTFSSLGTFATWQATAGDANSESGASGTIFTVDNSSGITIADYTLATGNAIDGGADLSAIGTYQFSDDISGTTRAGTWDAGAVEGTGGGVPGGGYGDEMVTNGTFADGGFAPNGDAYYERQGGYFKQYTVASNYNNLTTFATSPCLLDSSTAGGGIATRVKVPLNFVSGTTYRLTFSYYVPSGQSTVDGVKVWAYGTTTQSIANYTVTDTWTSVDTTFTAAENKNAIYFEMSDGGADALGAAGQKIYLDNISLKEVL